MRVTVVAVSAPALYQLTQFQKEFQEKYGAGVLDLQMFYVASAGAGMLARESEIVKVIASADIAVIDIMGASEAMQDLVRGGLSECKGQRIVIGNACRELNRLGAFSMDLMQKMKKSASDEDKKDSADTDEKAQKSGKTQKSEKKPEKKSEKAQKPAKNAAKMMHMMRRMAMMMGSIAPFGMMKDMKNLFLLIDYWQQAERDDIFSFMHLLLRTYGGMKQLPKEKPCSMKYGIYLKNPETKECTEKLKSYWKKQGFDREKPLVALLFYGHSYPNDFLPVVAAVYRRLAVFANVLPVAFSQNEDKDLPKLEAYLTGSGCPVEAVVSFMPFRLGAGPMGGDAAAAAEILKRIKAPYFKPFCLTKVERNEWERESGVNPGEFLISIMLPELDGGIHTYPAGIMTRTEYLASAHLDITRIEPIEERVEALCRRVQRYIVLRKKSNREKKIAVVCYNYPPGEDNLFGGAFLDTFSSVSVLLHALKEDGYLTEETDAGALKAFFCDGACNEPKWSDGKTARQNYSMDGKAYPVTGMRKGNIFIGLQPCRIPDGAFDGGKTGAEAAESSYHDKNLKPSEEYQAFYRWIAEEFKADAILHMGTHGTLEFLPGKDSGMTGACWPDRLIGDIPHFYYYYMGNPSEAMTAKRRSHAALISYQPPAFTSGGLYGDYQRLKETIAEYRESLQVSPERSSDILENIQRQAAELGLITDCRVNEGKGGTGERSACSERTKAEGSFNISADMLDDLDEILYGYETSLIPEGLHILGQGYTREEAERYADQLLEAAGSGTCTEKMAGNAVKMQNAEKTQRAEETEGAYRTVVENAMDNREVAGILAALRGEYLSVCPGGDILRNTDMLPAGKNLVQFDPRLVPTRTAFERGSEIARQTMERYCKEKGHAPESTAVILWGLETSKTQGETIGQIMYYLGIRMRQFEGSFDTRFEIIPTEELTRPRVDVTIHICGFFRDMYPNLIDNLNEIFRKLDALEESDEDSRFAKNTRIIYEKLLEQGYQEAEARELARSRIFGPKAGEYGTSLTEQVRKGAWTDESELAVSFTDSLSYVYSSTHRGICVRGLLDLNYRQVEMMSQVRNNVEYELIDLDHYYEFYGGLAKAVENVRGEKAVMYVADTVGAQIRTQDVRASMEKGIRTRLLNPKWIEGMMRHDYHGVQHISRRFENIIGLTATTNQIESRIFSDLEKCYVENESLKERMQKSNRWAYLNMLTRLAEAHNRGYWQATAEEMEALQRVYLETEGEIER